MIKMIKRPFVLAREWIRRKRGLPGRRRGVDRRQGKEVVDPGGRVIRPKGVRQSENIDSRSGRDRRGSGKK